MVWDKSPPELVRDTLGRVGRFLGLAGEEWSKLTETGMSKANSAESKKNFKEGSAKKFRITDLGADVCQEMSAFYREANQKLYKLLRTTKARASPEQPDFPEFADPCTGMPTK